jgi:hypothetical protein
LSDDSLLLKYRNVSLLLKYRNFIITLFSSFYFSFLKEQKEGNRGKDKGKEEMRKTIEGSGSK